MLNREIRWHCLCTISSNLSSFHLCTATTTFIKLPSIVRHFSFQPPALLNHGRIYNTSICFFGLQNIVLDADPFSGGRPFSPTGTLTRAPPPCFNHDSHLSKKLEVLVLWRVAKSKGESTDERNWKRTAVLVL